MRKEISLSIHLKKGQTKIRLNFETWRHTMLQREVGIYNDENYLISLQNFFILNKIITKGIL